MAVSLIRRIFTISLLYKTAQEGTSKKMQGHPLHVLGATITDGMTAVTIILAMGFGIIVPKIAIDRLTDSATRLKS